MAITEYNYIPKYIKRTIANKPKDVVTASYWNELFNLLITQGDHTAEELGNVLNHFTTVINAVKGIADGKYVKPTDGIPKTDLAATVQTSLDKAETALQSVPSTYRTAEAQNIIDNSKQPKLIAGENITIAEDGKTISATSDMDDVIGYFRVTLTKREDGLYTGSKTFAQVKAEIESNKRFMFIDGYDCVLIVTRVGNALIEFAGMSDGTDGWLWVGVASDDRWEIVPEVRVTLDWYNALDDAIGKLTNLTTTDKTNLVAAVNEVKQTTDGKQDKLIAGENITIAADGKTISATGGSSIPKPLTYDYMPEGYPKKAMGTSTVMEEQEVAFVSGVGGMYGGVLTDAFDIATGQTYTVNWDGTEYECVYVSDSKEEYLGNLSIYGKGEDTGEPFLYVRWESAFLTLDTSASHTISVKKTEEIVTPMSAEFIPTMNVSAFTNDAGYLTLATLPKYEGVVE